MNNFRLASAVFLAVLFLFPIHEIFAHGGAHKPEAKQAEASAAKDSMYSVKEADALSDSEGSLDNIFSPSDLFTQEELVDPMPMDDMKMGEHAEHQQAQVQLSHHERVSPSSKGFGTAVGITLFAGLVFAGLTYMRPGE